MSRRIEIELTSQRSPEEWTWRAAGAKLPKGTLLASLLYSDAKAGDVVKAEAEFEIEGITILQVSPPTKKRADKLQSINVVGSGRNDEQLVTQQLVDKKDRPRRPRREFGEGGGPGGDRGPRRDARPGGGSRDARPGAAGGGSRDGRPTGQSRDSRERTPRPERPARPPRPEAPTFKKLTPKDDARNAILETLEPEVRVIAEQVVRGGIPAVRQAIEAENTKAKAEGRPELNSAALIEMAEGLVPQLKAAEWMDRATAAKADVNEISVRDLRSVVSGADAVARTEEARLLAAELREALQRREGEARETWTKEITDAIQQGKSIRALRLSARPPDAQSKISPELLEKLKTAAEDSMSPETNASTWLQLVDAVSNSPIRRTVEPKGLPAVPGDELLAAAKAAAGRIPALGKMLGVTVPPPPPVRKPIPPKPTAAAAPAPAPTPAE